MKKRLIIATATLFLSVSAFAQFGITGGLTSTSSRISTAIGEIKTLNQYHVGVLYKFGVGNLLAIQPELIYNVKGTNFELLSGISDINFKTGFLELPVQVQVGVGIGSLARVYAVAEPFVGYAITNKITMADFTESNWDLIKDRIEYGVGLGAGFELFQHIQISARYFWNLGNLYGDEITIKGVTSKIGQSKCDGVVLSAAILF
ncbi:MAG: PorT family protein [Bacteroidales bacterium]|nr:PorT family protein [Bacteroidales bacterium]